jgi:hypothetical protein
MRKSRSGQKDTQFELFQVLPKVPRTPELPRETREKTTQLLARLLREHGARALASSPKREVWDE